MCGYEHEYRCPQRLDENFKSPGDGVAGGCEVSDMAVFAMCRKFIVFCEITFSGESELLQWLLTRVLIFHGCMCTVRGELSMLLKVL